MSLALAEPLDPALAPAATPAGARAPLPWREWSVMLAVWTAMGAFTLTQAWLASHFGPRPAPTTYEIVWTAESMWLWALFTPPMFWLAARFPLERGTWRRHLPAHAAAALGFCVLDLAGDVVFGPLLGGYHGTLPQRFFAKMFINVFSYAAVVGIAHAVQSQRALAARRAREAALERQLLQARLQALEAQIHPHFLFNTLHAVASLIRVKEDQAAIRMLVGLSDLLRLALRNRDAQEVPLRDELEFVRRYLEVERIRFEDRLRVEIDVAPDAPLDAPVPHLVLQPLVENAIRHGIEARPGAGSVRVAITADGEMLEMTVRDDGPGPGGSARRGVGLGNTRERLAHLYGERHRFDLAPAAEGGAVATVAIPLAAAHA